jgi:hypothetical protein
MGSALGTLFTWSTLVLSSHYQFNLPLVSMQSGSMGFLGALVYTLVAREALQTQDSGHFAPAASADLVGGTLFIATLLSRRVDAGSTPPNMRKSRFGMRLSKSMGNIMEEKGTIWFMCGYILVFFAIFNFLVNIAFILTQPPSHPATSTQTLHLMLSSPLLQQLRSARASAPTQFIGHVLAQSTSSSHPAFSLVLHRSCLWRCVWCWTWRCCCFTYQGHDSLPWRESGLAS